MLCADGEEAAEVYGCANDRKQSAIVFDVARDMIRFNSALSKRTKIIDSQKRIAYHPTRSFYQAMSSEVATKYGLNVSCCVFDELLGQQDRKFFDTMTKGSGAARSQSLNFVITTAGNNTHSICYEVYQKAVDILENRKSDSTFYPSVFGVPKDADWTDPKVWREAHPSLDITVEEDFLRQMCDSAKQNPAEENQFRQFFLNQWTEQSVRWMPLHIWDECAFPVDEEKLLGKTCYAGLDLSSTNDITALVLVFPPNTDCDKFQVIPYFWLPEDNIDLRVRRDSVPYDIWQQQGLFNVTEGNVIHYEYIWNFIERLAAKYNIAEVAFDRFMAAQITQHLENMGLLPVPFGQGFVSMNEPTKELMRLTLSKKIAHGGNPVLRWMANNICIQSDSTSGEARGMDDAGNIKPSKAKSGEKIDGIVSLIMALGRAMVHDDKPKEYDGAGVIWI
ncbi:phage terminase [Clostridia bacterium]|nr:phage terminase [Clostridia bacterium]